jgi:hypothetical protein
VRYVREETCLALVTHAADIHNHIVDQRFKWYFLMLERDLQRESCSCSKIVQVNWSNKVQNSLLKEPTTVNPMGMKAAQDKDTSSHSSSSRDVMCGVSKIQQIIRKILLCYGLNTDKIRLSDEWIRFFLFFFFPKIYSIQYTV